MQPAQPHVQHPDLYKKLLENIGDVGARIKILENRYANLGKKVQLTDQNLLQTENNASKEVRMLNQDILEIKKRIEGIREKLDILEGELGNAAKMHDLEAIEKYIDMWQPLNFVTKAELERYLKKE